jgi:integrase
MASCALLRWPAINPVVRDGQVEWQRLHGSLELPAIFFADGSAWSEANLWALHRASINDARTVQRNLDHLCAYAKWLEAEGLTWWHFPMRERDRCLVRFRGALIAARDRGELAPPTVSQRMASVVRFYRWVQAAGLFTPDWPMWEERQIALRLENAMGLERTIRVQTTNLAIPNRKAKGALAPEDGLMPVTADQMREILELAASASSQELTLMLRLGFGTGMRLGSICGLQIDTLANAQPCPLLGEAGWFRLAIGPGAKPPVPTKFDVSGSVLIARDLLEEVRDYMFSTRRLKRQAQAAPDHRQLLFLTRFGNPYRVGDSRAVNVEMSRLREAGRTAAVPVLREFHFHRTRATFLSQLMRAALSCLPVGDAIEFVREAALHRHEATTLKYVKFVEKTKAMSDGANAFTQAFLGLKK